MKGLNTANIETLKRTVIHRATMFPRETFRDRLKACDKAYYMFDGQRSEESEDSKPEADKVSKSRYAESGFSIVSPAVEAEVAFMYALFLSDPKIFSVVSPEKYSNLARAIQTANMEHSTHTKWLKNILKFFRDTSKYNLGFLQATWEVKQTYVPTLNTQGTDVALSAETWEGNSLRRIDPYNVSFDHTVDPSDLPENGEFFFTYEAMTQIQLYKLLKDLGTADENVGKVYNDNQEMWSSSPASTPEVIKYKELDVTEVVPSFILEQDLKKDKNDWFSFAGVLDDIKKNKSQIPRMESLYQVTKGYLRLVPKLYDCDVPDKDNIQIWRIVIVNGEHVVYVGKETNAHTFLPVGVAQPIEDSLGQNTLGLVLPLRALQEMGKQLKDRRLASLDRNISDRAVYDPNAIDGTHFKKNKSDSKIPLKATARDVDLKNAYMQIPFTDSTSYIFDKELAFVQQQADQQTGINGASRGQFVKGNKTLEEYQDVMSNADSKQYTRAAAIESQALSVVKHIIKWNLVQFGKDQVFVDPTTGQEITLNAADLKKAVFSFKLTDGLNPASKFLNAQEAIALFQLLQVMAQQDIQAGRPSIDFNKMLTHLLMQGKNIDISQYTSTQATSAAGGGTTETSATGA